MQNVLPVTVTKAEAQLVLEIFADVTGVPWHRHFAEKTYYSLGEVGRVNVYIIQSEMGTIRPGAALISIHKAIKIMFSTDVTHLSLPPSGALKG